MKSAEIPHPSEILTGALRRKKGKRTGYSQRALARDLGVSSTFVANVLSGKKFLPTGRVSKIAQLLDMDKTEKDLLRRSLMFHAIKSPELRDSIRSTQNLSDFTLSNHLDQFQRSRIDHGTLLREWYNIVILDFISCTPPPKGPDEIGNALGIAALQAEQSLKTLSALGLIEEKDGRLQKTEKMLFLPTTRSSPEVRGFHKEMLKKAFAQLNLEKDEDYERRLITGFTITVNPKTVELIKSMIFRFLGEASLSGAEEDCDEVYQLNVQFFPLTKKSR